MKHVTLWSAALCLVAVVFAARPAQADEFEISIANKFGEVRYARDAAILGIENGGLSAGFLRTSANDSLIHGTVYTPILEDMVPISFNIGARIYLASLVEPGDDIVGIAFGASARYKLPVLERWPIYLASQIFFAPEITTSGRSVDILDVHVIRAEMEVTDAIDALVGLRSVRVDRLLGDDDIVDERFYAGVRFRF